MKSKPSKSLGAAKVLAIWNIGLLIYFVWQVKFVEARYILMLIPSMIILAVVLGVSLWKKASKSSLSKKYQLLLQAFILLILAFVSFNGIREWRDWSNQHRNREHTNESILAGNWLEENAQKDLSIYCDLTCYIPDSFSKIVREKQVRLSKISELQTDIIVMTNSRYYQFWDSSRIDNFLLEKEKFWDIHYFYHAFQDSVYQNYHLWKDFEDVRIFKKENQHGKEKQK